MRPERATTLAASGYTDLHRHRSGCIERFEARTPGALLFRSRLEIAAVNVLPWRFEWLPKPTPFREQHRRSLYVAVSNAGCLPRPENLRPQESDREWEKLRRRLKGLPQKVS